MFVMKTIIVAVGACAIDTILTVPHFPEQDSKLRALSCTKRRGGNAPNTFEVLQQLVQADEHDHKADIELKVIATLPSVTSPSIPFIHDSFNLETSKGHVFNNVDLKHCVYREDNAEPVSSYIISDVSTGSRTIVNHNELEEMSFTEFKAAADAIYGESLTTPDSGRRFWYHFEGRIPETTLRCMQYLRQRSQGGLDLQPRLSPKLFISVELEKPNRAGLQALAHQADLIFYSRSWAEGEGYGTAQDCISAQSDILASRTAHGNVRSQTLICTWGDKGSTARHVSATPGHTTAIFTVPAFQSSAEQVVDTVGAGDTFIAGVIFAMVSRDMAWSLPNTLRFANRLAGYKIRQQGFSSLATLVLPLIKALENEAAQATGHESLDRPST